MGHRAPALIPSQPAAKAPPLHTRPHTIPAGAMPRNLAARKRLMDYESDPYHRR